MATLFDARYGKAVRHWSKQAGIGRGDGCCEESETNVQVQKPEAASKLWQESDSEAASKVWEELGREEEPTFIARFGMWAGFNM